MLKSKKYGSTTALHFSANRSKLSIRLWLLDWENVHIEQFSWDSKCRPARSVLRSRQRRGGCYRMVLVPLLCITVYGAFKTRIGRWMSKERTGCGYGHLSRRLAFGGRGVDEEIRGHHIGEKRMQLTGNAAIPRFKIRYTLPAIRSVVLTFPPKTHKLRRSTCPLKAG